MDLWVVAAAAATGYLAKYWKNLSRGENDLASDIPNIGKPESPNCPFSQIRQKKKLEKDASAVMKKGLDPTHSEKHQLGCAWAEVDSTDRDVLPTVHSVPALLENNNLICDVNRPSGDVGSNYENTFMQELDSLHGLMRKKGDLGYFPGRFAKPLNSIESCLMAQLRVEHANMDDYVLTAPPSPCRPAMRPLLVTNGSEIITRAYGDCSSAQIRIDDDGQHKKGNVSGIPQLPNVGYSGHHRKLNLRRGQWHNSRLSRSSKLHSGKQFQLQDGPHDGSFLFFLGVSIGIISSFMENTREVNKLKELLKQTENLVQDLQEELDMKESLTVKELANETSESQDACDCTSYNIAQPFFSERCMNNLTSNDSKESNNDKAMESSESMSKIEAELEAELERLGLNINTSISQRRLPDLDELDPDFAADFAEGELKVDMGDGQTVLHPRSNQEKSGTSTNHFQNYVVSPRELSLRLHEVIQSRLEERVKWLETALQNSQRKVQVVESGYDHSWRKLARGELMYSSTPESLVVKEGGDSMPRPLVVNLSGEAQGAYDEVYEEPMKTHDSGGEYSPSGFYRNRMDVRSISWGKNEEVERSLEHYSRVQELLDVGVSADENTDSDDEMDKQLIKQIVEKTKKGSPAVVNAQRLLFSMDERGH